LGVVSLCLSGTACLVASGQSLSENSGRDLPGTLTHQPVDGFPHSRRRWRAGGREADERRASLGLVAPRGAVGSDSELGFETNIRGITGMTGFRKLS
jgi:hypothetical protein